MLTINYITENFTFFFDLKLYEVVFAFLIVKALKGDLTSKTLTKIGKIVKMFLVS